MVNTTGHGGGCCGAKHLYSFGSNDQTSPADLSRMVAQNINGQAQEVILNGGQVTSNPGILERLASLGFVLDGHWHNGNHGSQELTPAQKAGDINAIARGTLGSDCYRFTRMDRRKPLNEGPIAGLWRGMVMTPGLHGLLDQMRGTAAVNDPNNADVIQRHWTRPLPAGYRNIFNRFRGQADRFDYAVGDRIVISRGDSNRRGRVFDVIRMHDDGYDVRVVLHDAETGQDFRILQGNVDIVRRVARPAPERPQVGQRVQYIGHRYVTNSWYNNEYATITTVEWPYLVVEFDRQPQNRNTRGLRVHSQYLVLRDDAEAVLQPIQPLLTPQVPAVVDQVHVDAEVLTERPQAAREVVPAAPVVLFRSYHNIYRGGRVGAGYDTFVAARDARNGDGRVDRREMLSDGSSRMVEDVTE